MQICALGFRPKEIVIIDGINVRKFLLLLLDFISFLHDVLGFSFKFLAHGGHYSLILCGEYFR